MRFTWCPSADKRILSKDIHNYILCVVQILMKQTLPDDFEMISLYIFNFRLHDYNKTGLRNSLQLETSRS